MGDFYSDNDIPMNGDTVYVRLNDSVFIDTEGLTRSITHYSTYREYDKVVQGNNTTWYYCFTVDQEYLDILRKQIKGN